MLASDAQKYYTLKYINYNRDARTPRKPFLINDGFFKYTRNPNYLGEIMLYLGFFNLTGHWIAYCVGLNAWIVLFSVRMAQKDSSLR
jgi:protein-S-isoprenylcysteine O-methyltransferase Ste14